MLEALVHAPMMATVTCCHVRTAGLDWSDDDDYVSFHYWTDDGRAIQELARTVPWLEPVLAPLRRLVRG
jgi:hypothetical protein